ncbi:FKBP12-interacting protein of 37 kDa [Ancistrocladus abbreviatus]
MASHSHFDDDDDFGGDIAGAHSTRRSGSKRSFGELDDDEDEIFGSKKGSSKLEETAPGVATGMILSLRESLQKCKDDLAKYQTELEAARSEIQRWHSWFENESFIPSGTHPEPKYVVNYLQTLRSSEVSLKEQLEKAKKKEAAFIVTFAKREQEIAELRSAVRELRAQLKPPSMQARKLLLDPAIHEEFMRLKNLVEQKEKQVKELQDNMTAVNFTPQSKFGKMLMAKCRTLQEENEEIGYQASEGKMNELGMKLALQKSQNAELRSQFEALYKQMEGLTNEMEKSNEMVVILQEKLEEKDSEILRLKNELEQRNLAEEKADVNENKIDVDDEVQSPEAEAS